MKKLTRNIDYQLILSVVLLFSIGLLGIFSASKPTGEESLIFKQIVWFTTGIGLIILIQFFSLRYLEVMSSVFYVVLLLMLILIYFIGSTKMGAQRWFNLGFFQFQPSEIGKFIMICALASYYSNGKIFWNNRKYLINGLLITFVPAILVFKQPDLGTSLVYIFLYVAIIFSAGVPYYYLLNMFAVLLFIVAKGIGMQFFVTALIVYGLVLYKFSKNYTKAAIIWLICFFTGIGSTFIWDKLKPYQRMRILTFLDPEKFSREGGWQVVQSKVAVSNGSFLGEGFLNGSQVQLRFLPEGHTDFIFSVISEEFGLMGVLILFSLLALFIYRLIKITMETHNKFLYLVSSGITALFIFQIILNIGITIGIMPVTGLPLPFLSYGGSALLVNMIMIGVIISINREKKVI
ncbi:MAG: rod shape-determining protein RodA [Candidatus Delongbacteria bacterium]|jgi:rod shape determining protein RodA|nr:rod shape-determining protein RodA [Candidatus Delongbacteria bacterium]